MTSITDIPIDDVELFLSSNGFTITDNPYEQIWSLINKNIEYDFYPDSVIDWMIAYNLHQRNVKIQKYKRSEILSMDNMELHKLDKLLRLNNVNKDQILNILHYLHKLDEEVNVIQHLPEELIVRTLENLSIDEIEPYCKSSKQIKQACHSQLGFDLIRARFGDDTLDTHNFTFDELLFYSKVLPFKKKIPFKKNRSFDITGHVLYLHNNKLLSFDGSIVDEIIDKHNINQFAFYGVGVIILLTNTGELISYDINKKKELGVIAILDKVIGIFNISKYDVHILTAKGVSYEYKKGILSKFDPGHKIVQLYDFYYLTDRGEVYFILNKINNLPKIKQITEHGYSLSYDNSIYYQSHKIYTSINEIKEICEYTYGLETDENLQSINRLLILYEEGNVDNMETQKTNVMFMYPMDLPEDIVEINADDGYGTFLSINKLGLFNIYDNDIIIHNIS